MFGKFLGLAIIELVVEAYSGRIPVESVFGKGTTFDIAITVESEL